MDNKKKPIALVRTEHAKTWHIDDPEAPDGGPRSRQNVVRRAFSAEYKLAILAEYDRCTESGEKGALLRREGLYSSLVTDWRRQHRMGLLKAAVGRSDGGRGGPSLSEVATASRKRTAAHQAGPGRGDHRSPGKSARALGGDLQERGDES
jgi:transposase-like protein